MSQSRKFKKGLIATKNKLPFIKINMKNLSIEVEMLTEDNRKDILNSFLETISSISDVAYQKRAWIRGEPPGTDFDETVNNYSLDAEGILEYYKDFKITEIQFHILKKFNERFRSFYRKNNCPPEFIDTPEWNEITMMAKEILQAFDYQN
jgi:hypothetical protein